MQQRGDAEPAERAAAVELAPRQPMQFGVQRHEQRVGDDLDSSTAAWPFGDHGPSSSCGSPSRERTTSSTARSKPRSDPTCRLLSGRSLRCLRSSRHRRLGGISSRLAHTLMKEHVEDEEGDRSCAPALLSLLGPPCSGSRVRRQRAPQCGADWAPSSSRPSTMPAAPRSAGTSQILQATVMLAVYDAAVAVEGGYRPYAAEIRRRRAPTCARRSRRRPTARPAPVSRRRRSHTSTPSTPPTWRHPRGLGKADGIRVGEAAARRSSRCAPNDASRRGALRVQLRSGRAGEFEPDSGCPAGSDDAAARGREGRPDPAVHLRQERAAIRPAGPDPLTSASYVEDFEETRDYGRSDSAVRSPNRPTSRTSGPRILTCTGTAT